MTTSAAPSPFDVTTRAHQSRGASGSPIYNLVAEILKERHPGGGTLLDVGCGTGNLWPYVSDRFDRYLGADVVRYEGFPENGEFHHADLDRQLVDLPAASADVVVAVETIEHLENPRAFTRELVRLTRPNGWVMVTTPNQLSLLSKLTLVFRNQFNAFQSNCYPAHLTALLEIDLQRIVVECGLGDVVIRYTGSGRIPGLAWHFPELMSRIFPRSLSDNVLVAARKLHA